MLVPCDGFEYGCLFCKTGDEERLARDLSIRYPEIHAFTPMKLRYRRFAGTAKEERVVLFPGYVFFKTEEDFPMALLSRERLVYRLLRSGEDDWRLRGSDRALVERFESEGIIGFSKAWYEGDRIRIADGFLKEHQGQIIRVNRRAQTAQIELDFAGKHITVWLGFELIEAAQTGGIEE